MREIWKDIKGYEGFYKVSNLGRVKRVWTQVERKGKGGCTNVITFPERIRKITEAVCRKTGTVRYHVNLCKEGGSKVFVITALVAEAFIGPRPKDGYIKHINGDIRDNRAENLCYKIYRRSAA